MDLLGDGAASAPVDPSSAGVLLDGELFLRAAHHRPLSPRVQQVLADHRDGSCYVSVVSFWQLLLRERAGLERLPHPVAEMLQGERSILGIQTLPLQEDCLVHLHRLQDLDFAPCDQLLICQALQHGLQLLTERPIFRNLSRHTLPLEVVF